MKKTAMMFLVSTMTLGSLTAFAADLPFPKTEAEIIQALSIKDGKTVHQGVEYVSETGRVWKIIDGKRFRVRGLQGIEDSVIVPKAAALINFDTNSAQIRSDSFPLLDEYGKALKGGLAEASIMIAGYTDSKGSDEYNNKLSAKRAESVVKYLTTRHGIETARLTAKAYGKKEAIASNSTEEGRALNRRVEFVRVE